MYIQSMIDRYISRLGLMPHPEGGWYRETYRSSETTAGLPARFPDARHFSTAIYFLVPGSTSPCLSPHQVRRALALL
jgi:predicted cupin superfamily sugar epimerase